MYKSWQDRFGTRSAVWSERKNAVLQEERGLSFEAVVSAIENGQLLDDIAHSSAGKFSHQRILVVRMDGYACAVPYVFDESEVFLKTIYKSRELHARYGQRS